MSTVKTTYKHYVYMYLDTWGVPFYVGKGKNLRYLPCCHINGDHHSIENKIKKIGEENIRISFLIKDVSDKESMQWERFFIKLIGRKDLGLGPLCNLTNGGDGSEGHKQSEETKEKRRQGMYKAIAEGRVFTPEHRRKIGEGRKGIPASDKMKTQLKAMRLKQIEDGINSRKGWIPSEKTRQIWREKRQGVGWNKKQWDSYYDRHNIKDRTYKRRIND